jgi:hypothetical protein
VLQLINGFRDRGLATPFTADVLLRAGITESLVPRVLRSMEQLELIDADGNPTPQMEGLRRASSADFRTRLEEIVRGVYAEVFQFTNPATDPPTKVADAFRAYEPIGQRGRMVTLFLGLCEAGGIIAEGAARKQAPTGTSKKPAAKPATRRTTEPARGGEPARANIAGVDPLIAAAVQKLPPNGTGWTKDEREKWLAFFTTTLDFTVPIREAQPVGQDETDDE